MFSTINERVNHNSVAVACKTKNRHRYQALTRYMWFGPLSLYKYQLNNFKNWWYVKILHSAGIGRNFSSNKYRTYITAVQACR